MESVEKECGALGGLFQAIVNDMKSSYPVWEDFSAKATKLHSQLRTTILAAVAFLDAFQKVADMATNSRGATRDIGSALTRMCMRHRSIEGKLRLFTNALMEGLVTPLQDRIEEWKKTANQLDKDHAKEYKRSRQEIKRKSLDTIKLQKKARKELLGRGNLRPQLDSAMQDVSDLYLLMEETEKQAVRRALLEERGRYCTFINLLQSVVTVEIAMLGEITHLQPIVDDLTGLTEDPHKLPPASEQVIRDLKGSDYSWSYQTPPSSPSSANSRKSSMCSLLQMPSAGAHRLSSVSSHDSGFVSQDANTHSKPPSPMPSDITSQDWAKLSSCEPSLASTLQRRRESVEKMRELEAPPSPHGYSGMQPDDSHRGRLGPASKHGEPLSPAASTLAMVLTRGLSMEQQKSSRDSLQYSSGYSTQTNTPSCSEDTIPSQGSDYECYSLNGDADSEGQADFDKSSTIPRHSNIAQSYRRMIQTKRPASTAGLPAGKTLQGTPNGAGGSSSGAITSGTATIRRTPSSKTGVRRTPSTSGPIPIRPPIVPVKTPTVPDSPGYGSPSLHGTGSEEFLYGDDLSANDYMRASPKRMSLPDTTWGLGGGGGGGGGGGDRTVYAQQAAGMAAHSAEEDPLLAANRHSLVEKIGELAASAHALGEGQFPFPSLLLGEAAQHAPQDLSSVTQEDMDMLVSIRRGVRLRKTVTDDRSGPRILR
ncbi:MTSS I-BAR domain containing 2a isoform X4 [Hippoglossus hippoglossus]|uniref:MTSS I-BAR domain containing 2a isoform X4 n=1 Tax=Hippoglossus hippoglossus TaxID=8267 RepID=UPI00148D584E|nr:MTSS I-BAR domain containing 2a isoform X4 [Hippoglossus hippoglossus]